MSLNDNSIYMQMVLSVKQPFTMAKKLYIVFKGYITVKGFVEMYIYLNVYKKLNTTC